jgi:hypothetical protein
VLAASGASGCGPAAAGGPAAAAVEGDLGAGDWRTDTVPPARTMARVAETLAGMGYAPTGAEGRAFIVRQRMLTMPVPLEAGRCYVIVATSSRELADLDSYLFQASGALADQDRRRDNHPTIAHCAAETGTAYVVYEAFDGNGLFYHAVFAGPAGTPVAAEDLFADVEAEPGEGPAPAGPEDVEERAAAFVEVMIPRGFAVAEQGPAVHIAAGEAQTTAVALAVDRCYTFCAFGAAGATDVDLYLTAPDGETVALDEQPAVDAFVQWCPVAEGEFELKVQMAGEAGDALVVRLEAPAERVGGLDGLWLGSRRPPGPTHRDLDAGAAEMKARLERLGYRVDDAASLEGAAEQLVIRTHAVDLGADKCHVFGAVGGPDVANLDLYLYDEDGNEVAADEALNATPVVQVCPQRSDSFRVDVAMRGGGGPYRVVRGSSPAVGAEASRGLDTVARTRLRTVVDRIHLAELTPLGPPQTVQLAERGVRRFQDNLEAGECCLFVAVGAGSVVDIDLYVMDPTDSQVGRDDQPDAMPAVQFCAAKTGAYSTDVRMVEGSGALTLLRYRTGRSPATASAP